MRFRLEPGDKRQLLRAALGETDADLAVANCRLVNVFTGEIYPVVVYVKDGFIAHVEQKELEGPYRAGEIYDGGGNYLIPGFIDAHMHIESSMMTPRNFAKAVIPHGTTTIVHDPHEIGNVYGVEGVAYMHDSAEGLPMRQLVDIPSCVPAVPGCEHAGAVFGAGEVAELCSLERAVGLAEVMDFYGVLHGEDRMMEVIKTALDHGLYIQGHAPLLSGRELSAYLCGGPETCHETSEGGEALEKLRNGMYVDARESSIVKNVGDIWEGVKNVKFYDRLTFCSDDRESDDILEEGHMDAVVRKAVASGMDPVLAIKSVTINAAQELGIGRLGAVAPGYAADMVLVKDLTELKAQAVFFGGALVAEEGRLLAPVEKKSFPIEERNSMRLEPMTAGQFKIPCPVENGRLRVHVMEYVDLDSSFTRLSTEEVEVRDGRILLTEGLSFAAVANRYGRGTMGLGLVRNFGLSRGAVASTVSHDSHNLTVVYDSPENASAAANELIACGGGMTAVEEDRVLHTLRLEIAGLMTALEAGPLAAEAKKMKEAERSLGLSRKNPLLRIVTLALPVIPEVKLSDLGLVEVRRKRIIPLMAE